LGKHVLIHGKDHFNLASSLSRSRSARWPSKIAHSLISLPAIGTDTRTGCDLGLERFQSVGDLFKLNVHQGDVTSRVSPELVMVLGLDSFFIQNIKADRASLIEH
jgi:hypothetical protein